MSSSSVVRARRRIAFAELGLGQAQHQIGIVLVKAGERLAVLGDRLVVAPVAREFLGVALATGHVAGHAGFALVAAQVGAGIHCLLEPRAGALRRAAAEQLRDDLHGHVGEAAGKRTATASTQIHSWLRPVLMT